MLGQACHFILGRRVGAERAVPGSRRVTLEFFMKLAYWLALAPLITGGCSSGSDTHGDSKTLGAADAAPPGFGPSDADTSGIFVKTVTGRFLDPNGNPPSSADFTVSVCGPICYFGDSASDGSFSTPIGARIDLSQYSALPHGRPYIAGFYFALPTDAPGPAIDLGDLRIIPMPQDGAPIDPTGATAQTLTSGPVTLDIAQGLGTHLEFDDLAAAAAGSEFRAVTVDPHLMGRFVPQDADAIIALGPFESYEFDAGSNVVPTHLTFANTAGLAPGKAVEFLALGTYLHPDWIPPAEFTSVATGRVSADGARIDLDAGEGLLYLTWVAIRATGGE